MSKVKDKTDNNKKIMLDALDKVLGNVSQACKNTGLSRAQHYVWIDEDAAYSAAVDHILEKEIDHVESKLQELINGAVIDTKDGPMKLKPEPSAVIFYLKTKGKKRGYQEKQVIEQTNLNQDIELTQEQIDKLIDKL